MGGDIAGAGLAGFGTVGEPATPVATPLATPLANQAGGRVGGGGGGMEKYMDDGVPDALGEDMEGVVMGASNCDAGCGGGTLHLGSCVPVDGGRPHADATGPADAPPGAAASLKRVALLSHDVPNASWKRNVHEIYVL